LQRWGSRNPGLTLGLVRRNRAAFLPDATLYRDPDVSPRPRRAHAFSPPLFMFA
jgi:hypothetical protein